MNEDPIDPAAFAAAHKKKVTKKYYDQRAKWRQLMKDGLEGTAAGYAKKHGLDAAQMKAELEEAESPPAPVQTVRATEPEPGRPERVHTATLAETANGWPVETTATIWAGCRNSRLMLIRLPDEREASMWTTGRRWRIGARLRVRLDSDQAKGDPRYLPIEGSIE